MPKTAAKPLTIGVLIPYYNGGTRLTECLESLFVSGTPDEVLLYDDASPLPPEPFCGRFRVRILKGTTNLGPAGARNELLRAASSDYVHFHDQDDLFESGWLSRMREEILLRAPDLIMTDARYVRGEDGELIRERLYGFTKTQVTDLVSLCLSYQNPIVPCVTTFRREAALRLGGYRNMPTNAEFDFHVRLSQACASWSIVPEALVVQRLLPGTASRDSENAPKTEPLVGRIAALERLAQELPPRYRPDLGENAFLRGVLLYRLGYKDEAGEAFLLARKLGARYEGRHPLYRRIAAIVGPARTEGMARVYRRLLPASLRAQIRQRAGN